MRPTKWGVHSEMDGDTVVAIPYTEEEKTASGYDFESINVGELEIVYNGAPYGYQQSTEGMDGVAAKMTTLKCDSAETAEAGGQEVIDQKIELYNQLEAAK